MCLKVCHYSKVFAFANVGKAALDICRMESLEVTAILLDELIRDPEHPTKNHILHFESLRLREIRGKTHRVHFC